MVMVVVVVVWTVSWPRRERCPGTVRVTIPRPLPLSSPPTPPYLFFYTTCSRFLRLFSLSLFLLYLSVKLSPAFPRSFYRGLPRAGRPFRAAPVNQYGGGLCLPLPRQQRNAQQKGAPRGIRILRT